jgi:hypothetical protein
LYPSPLPPRINEDNKENKLNNKKQETCWDDNYSEEENLEKEKMKEAWSKMLENESW